MKLKLLDKLIMLSKLSLYGLVIQCFMLSSIWAEDISAQKIQSVNDVMVDLGFTKAKLEKVFKLLENQTDFHFSYSKEDIDPALDITFNKGKFQAVRDVLIEVSKKSGLRFRQVNRNIIVQRPTEGNDNPNVVEIFIENVEVEGKITDENGEGLPGASVIEKGTTNGTTTDLDGQYKISLPENATVVISFVGYKTQEVTIAGRSTIDLQMELDAEQLEEVVVVGYGTLKKKDLTGAVSSVSSKDIKNLPDPNLVNQIQGRVAGLTISNSDFRAGEGPDILVRGKNSITASNNPLIILDGLPYDGSIATINPNDIESINVLKDASSTAIYGSRGSNGVVLITTKSGDTGKPVINYSGSVGFNSIIRKVDVLDADQYLELRNTLGTLHPSEQANYDNNRAVDWQDLATRRAVQQNHSIGISGGADKLSYYLGIGHLDQEGIVVGNEYARTSFRFNGTYTINDWLKIGTSNQVTSEDWGDQGDIDLSNALMMSPLGTPYNEDGSSGFNAVPEQPFFRNPLDVLNTTDERIRRKMVNNIFAEVQLPLKGLSYKFNFGRSEERESRDQYSGAETTSGFDTGGRASRMNATVINTTTENILNYSREFGDHHVGFTGLYSFQEYTNDQTSISSVSFVNDNLGQYGVGTGSSLLASTPYSEWSIVSQMVRVNYDYKGKYFFTYTVRRDGYSGFGANEKYGVFPSVAVGWTLSDESFLSDNEWINFLKFRASYGVNGNQAVDPYQTLTSVSGDNGSEVFLYHFDGPAIGFAPTVLGNPDLGWEQTKTLNFGFDYTMLEGKISGSLEYYSSSSDGLLLRRLLNSTQGFTSILQNVGKTTNKGLEISVNATPLQKGDLTWDVGLNFFKNSNKIVQLFDEETDDVLNGWFIGEDIDSNFDYVVDGVFSSQQEVDASHMPGATPGDLRLKDVNGDGVLDGDDRAIQGSVSPDFTLGLNNTLTYKNLSLSMFWYTVQGVLADNKVLDPITYLADRTNYGDLDYWSPNNLDATSPKPDYAAGHYSYFQDRSYIRLRNITLGYNFDQNLVSKIGFSSLGVYMTGNNLITITDWEGFDPETRGPSRQDGNVYPSFKSIMIGINASF